MRKVALRNKGTQLVPGLAGKWMTALFSVCLLYYLFWVPKLDATELPLLILSIDWVFPLFFFPPTLLPLVLLEPVV